ncbi:LOW QUALITY PROTEIN: uncharacterized protein FYW61_012062 [Anableps anableps]
MANDELDLELIRKDIQKQTEILKQDKQDIQQQRQELESTLVELHNKKEETKNLFDGINKDKSKLKDLNLHLKTQADKLKALVNVITLKPEEPERKGPEFYTQTQTLELSRKKLQGKREELEVLMRNTDRMKERVRVSMSSVLNVKEQVISMKMDIEKDREKLSIEREHLERELSEFKMRQDGLLNVMKPTANLRRTLQGVKDKVCELSRVKMGRLHKGHEDAQLLCNSLERKLSTIGDQMKKVTPYTELVEREKITLTSIISSMSNQRELMEHQWKQMVDLDKERLNKMKAELKRESQNLERVADKIDKDKEGLESMMSDMQKQRAILQQEKRDIEEERETMNITKTELDQKVEEAHSCLADINKEKSKLRDLSVSVQRKHERFQDIMNMVTLKQQERQMKDQRLQTQSQELQSKGIQLQKEKEEMELLITTANKMREWIKAAMAIIHKEKQEVDRMRMDKRGEEYTLSIDNIEPERERPELTAREDIDLEEGQITEHHTGKIQHIKEKLNENIKVKMGQLKQSIEGVEKLSVFFGQKLLGLNEQKENVAGYKEVFEREKEILNTLLCDTLKQREEMENNWKQMVTLDKDKGISFEAAEKKKKPDLDIEKQKMANDELDLELIRKDIQKQTEILKQDKQDIQQQRQELESTLVELHNKKEETKNLFDGINKDKSKLKDLNLHLKTQADKLKALVNVITLKPEEPERKGPEFYTQTQTLELSRKKLQGKREELEVLMRNTDRMKERVRVSMSSVLNVKEQVISMKMDIEKDREKLSIEREHLERELSEFKMRQDGLLNVMKPTANLRRTLQGVKDKVCELSRVKMGRLHKGHEDAQLLCNSLERKLSTIGDQMKKVTPYTELVEREKITLTSIISSMSNQRELMEHQWKQMVDLDKERLNKMKAELKRESQNLERVADKIDKDKEGLESMMSDMQKQRAILQQEKRDIEEERETMNITKTELDQKVEEAHSCLADINKEKSKLRDLSVSVQRKHERFQDIMNMVTLKQQERQMKDQRLQTQSQELQSKGIQLQKEKEEMELLITTANKMREWIKAAMAIIHKEKQEVDRMRMDKRGEEYTLSIDNIEPERERPELTAREDIDLEEGQITEHHTGKIQHIKEKLNENIKVKMGQLKQSIEGVEKLSVFFGQKLLGLNEQKENVAGYKEVFEREKEILNTLLCDTLKQREEMENHWKQMVTLDKDKGISFEAAPKKGETGSGHRETKDGE